MNTITILGSGTSTGIPMIGCHCDVCSSSFKKNKRMRTSILIQTENGHSILVDTTPDLRTQFLKNKIENIDGVIITHEHADHLHGIFGGVGFYVIQIQACANDPAPRLKFTHIADLGDGLVGTRLGPQIMHIAAFVIGARHFHHFDKQTQAVGVFEITEILPI